MKDEDSLYVPVPDTIFSPVLVGWTFIWSTQYCLLNVPISHRIERARRRKEWEVWATVNFNIELVELIAQREVPLNDVRVYESIDFSSHQRPLRLTIRLLEET